MSAAYIQDPRNGPGEHVSLRHLDGIPWHEAPVPSHRHKCWAQTDGWSGLNQVWRCACGAICSPDKYAQFWADRNSRVQPAPPAPHGPTRTRRIDWHLVGTVVVLVVVIGFFVAGLGSAAYEIGRAMVEGFGGAS